MNSPTITPKDMRLEDVVIIQCHGPENEPITIWYNRRHKIFKISYDKSKVWDQVLNGEDAKSALNDWLVYLGSVEPIAEEIATRPSTDYEKAMSGRDRMPANSTPWHD